MTTFWLIFAAYYAVGVIVFIRDLRTASEDKAMMRMFDDHLSRMSNLEFAWDAFKVALFLVFIHIPCWIIRV